MRRRGAALAWAMVGGALLAVGCVPAPPQAPSAPEFDPKVVFRDLAKGSSRPMVVDWTPDDRASLEMRATRGAILVKISDAGIEPLWDCTVPDGSRYEYTGVSPKHDHVSARSDAELAANFPMGFARLRSIVRSGQAVSADIRMIGVAELNRLSVSGAGLPPPCSGATHFVKELTIGGFQFGSSAVREASAGAGVGDVGGDVGTSGISSRLTAEGDFKVCEEADPDSRSAPSRCKGILRIRLVPLDRDANEVQTMCGAGMRWDGTSCIQPAPPPGVAAKASPAPTRVRAYECRKGDVAECVTQCRNGSASSCTFAGQAMAENRQGTLEDVKALFRAACDGEHWEGCSGLGDVFVAEQKATEAALLHGTACLNGFSGGCTNYGVAAYFGYGGLRQDRALAFKLWERACRLGDFVACANAGVVVNKGEAGIPRDPTAARRLFDVSCKNGKAGGCTNLAFMFELGLGGPRDPNEALKLFAGACEQHNPAACVGAGLLLEEGAGGNRARIGEALALYERACNYEVKGDGCASSAETKAAFGQHLTDEQIARRSCDGSTQSELGCYNAALVYSNSRSGFANPAKATEFAKRACMSAGAQKPICRGVSR